MSLHEFYACGENSNSFSSGFAACNDVSMHFSCIQICVCIGTGGRISSIEIGWLARMLLKFFICSWYSLNRQRLRRYNCEMLLVQSSSSTSHLPLVYHPTVTTIHSNKSIPCSFSTFIEFRHFNKVYQDFNEEKKSERERWTQESRYSVCM